MVDIEKRYLNRRKLAVLEKFESRLTKYLIIVCKFYGTIVLVVITIHISFYFDT